MRPLASFLQGTRLGSWFLPSNSADNKSSTSVRAGTKRHVTTDLASRSVSSRSDTSSLVVPMAPFERQQALRQFAIDILALDQLVENESVGRLAAACRTLQQQDTMSTDAKTTADLLDWVTFDLFYDKPEVLRLLIHHRQALQLPFPSPTFMAKECYTGASWHFFRPFFDKLPEWWQQEFLRMGVVLEHSLNGTETLALWYKNACKKLNIPLETDALWERCRNPETTDCILSPCFNLISREEQLAVAVATIRDIASGAITATEVGMTAFPPARESPNATYYKECRVIALLGLLAKEQPDQMLAWLLRQDASFQAVTLFLHVRHYSPGPDKAALDRMLNSAMQQGMAPNPQILQLSDASGQFLSHYFFKEKAYAALGALSQYINLKQGSVAGHGAGPEVGTQPLSSLELYAHRRPHGEFPLFDDGAVVPDFPRDLRRMHTLIGEDGLLELMLEAGNRGTPAWWVWILRCLQLYPGLQSRLLEDPRAWQISLKLSWNTAVPLPAMLNFFWYPLAPLDQADLQQFLLQEIIQRTMQTSCDDEDRVQPAWALLDASLILCEPYPCRWLLQHILTDKNPFWCQLRNRFFDGRSTNFYQLLNLLTASWCSTNCAAPAQDFDAYLTEKLASPLCQSECRAPDRCLTETQYPALFKSTAAGTYGRTVWFRTKEGVIRLKLHKKGEPLADLLREQLALEFVKNAQLPLKGQRPEPLGSGWLPDFTGWLERSGLDATTQNTLCNSVQKAEDGAVWGVVLRTSDEGYHEYAHEPDARGCPDAALAGIELAALDAGVLLRHGLVPTNLLPLYHANNQGDRRTWHFAYDQALGEIQDWDGSATDHGNVARAPYGLRDWADVRTFEAMESDPAVPCQEQRWQSGTLKVNEAGKLLTGLTLLLARLNSADFDCDDQQRVEANRVRVSGQVRRVFQAFMEGFTDNRDVVMAWRHNIERRGLLDAAARQIVFWCETGESPSFEQHLRNGTLPEDIPYAEGHVHPQTMPLRSSFSSKNTLRGHARQYPLVQLSALIYLTLGHAIAGTDTVSESTEASKN